jgi:glutamate/tyrosine decarboxylase-like PLP-dependent enzyme
MTLQQRMFQLLSERTLFEQAKTDAFDYLDQISDRAPYPNEQALAGLKSFAEPMPSEPAEPAEMLRMLHEFGSPATVVTTGGKYYGLVTGSTLPPVMAVRWLADTWDQLAALYVTSPLMATLEDVCQQWLLELFNLPAGTAAGFVSGTSMATFCGLAAARYALLQRAGWDVNSKGLFGAPEIKVVVGAEAHSTVWKALALLGLGKDRVELVPTDDQGRMRADLLPPLDDRTLVIAQAGNVNSGSFDLFDSICDRARTAGAWVHIDGAFGLWAAASQSTKHLTAGFQKADSWSVDGHKTLNTPYDCGIILCRQPEMLAGALQATGSYIIYGEHRDGMLYTPEMSRRGRAVELWATLKVLGRSGVDELVELLCSRARQAADLLRQNGFNVLNDVVFNQVLVAGESPEQTQAMLQSIQASGKCWCGGARWHDQPVIRISVCSWATTSEDIEDLVSAFVLARHAC